jgi:hypothetical protein
MKYLVILALLAGCASMPRQTCNMAEMTPAQIERAFVVGCYR